MSDASPFKWRHFEADIILCAVRWYLRDALSYRDVEELLRERGGSVDHTTVFRWVQRYAPELDQQCRPHLSLTNDSYRVDETVSVHLGYRATRQDACHDSGSEVLEARTEQAPRRGLLHRRL
jgi:transposase-like protein